ncbi:MAG: hypothetical protein ACRESX_07765 [Gammaproteobacteria bacterium]
MNQTSTKLRIPYVVAILVLYLCTGFSVARAASDNALMQESFQQFDQNLSGGWRTLQVKGDYLGAAKAMLDYLSVHSATLKPGQKDSLAFHLGHVYALAGNKQEAIHWFRKSIADHLMGNPAYTQSFIAFLENDRSAFLADRHTIATINPGPWRAGDLREMDTMLEYFGEPFEAAWGALNCHNPAAESTTAAWIEYCRAMDAKYRDLYAKHGIK